MVQKILMQNGNFFIYEYQITSKTFPSFGIHGKYYSN